MPTCCGRRKPPRSDKHSILQYVSNGERVPYECSVHHFLNPFLKEKLNFGAFLFPSRFEHSTWFEVDSHPIDHITWPCCYRRRSIPAATIPAARHALQARRGVLLRRRATTGRNVWWTLRLARSVETRVSVLPTLATTWMCPTNAVCIEPLPWLRTFWNSQKMTASDWNKLSSTISSPTQTCLQTIQVFYKDSIPLQGTMICL